MAPPESIFGARERGRGWRGADRDHSLSCSGKVCGLSALSAVNHCPATQTIANAGKRALKVSLLCRDKILMGKKVAYA
jgi:hypothetical protein